MFIIKNRFWNLCNILYFCGSFSETVSDTTCKRNADVLGVCILINANTGNSWKSIRWISSLKSRDVEMFRISIPEYSSISVIVKFKIPDNVWHTEVALDEKQRYLVIHAILCDFQISSKPAIGIRLKSRCLTDFPMTTYIQVQ